MGSFSLHTHFPVVGIHIQHVLWQMGLPCDVTSWWPWPPAEVPLPTTFPRSLSPSFETVWELCSPSLQFAVCPALVPHLSRAAVPSTALHAPSPPSMTHVLPLLRQQPHAVPILSSSSVPPELEQRPLQPAEGWDGMRGRQGSSSCPVLSKGCSGSPGSPKGPCKAECP